MKESNSRYVYIVDCREIKCVYCGSYNEITRNLLNIEIYWIEADSVEFCCSKCGKPFVTSEQLMRGRGVASALQLE